jgi:CubicO group peptidase (beta-lactamase class C family)
MVIEKVTGKSLATVLRHDLLNSARLDRVWMQGGTVPERPAPPRAWPVDDPANPIVNVPPGSSRRPRRRRRTAEGQGSHPTPSTSLGGGSCSMGGE